MGEKDFGAFFLGFAQKMCKFRAGISVPISTKLTPTGFLTQPRIGPQGAPQLPAYACGSVDIAHLFTHVA